MKNIFQVEAKELKSFPDQRGFFREIIRSSDDVFAGGNFGQWSHSKMQQNVVKAWHYHHRQTDWWYIPVGTIKMALYDYREESPTFKTLQEFYVGEESNLVDGKIQQLCVRIPPGVLHGLKVLSEFAHLFYVTSHVYNPNDEGRLPFDTSIVGYDWGSDVIVAENDMRTFTPTSPRALIDKSCLNV